MTAIDLFSSCSSELFEICPLFSLGSVCSWIKMDVSQCPTESPQMACFPFLVLKVFDFYILNVIPLKKWWMFIFRELESI